MAKFALVAEKTGEAVYARISDKGLYRLPKEKWATKDIDVSLLDTYDVDDRWDEVVTVDGYKQTHGKMEGEPAWKIQKIVNSAAKAAWNDVMFSSATVVLSPDKKTGRYTDAAFDYFMDAMPDCAERDERIGRCFEHGTESEDVNLDAAEFWYKKAEAKGFDFAKQHPYKPFDSRRDKGGK